MQMLELIAEKRAGKALTEEEIAFFVRGVTDRVIPDEQTAAFLMAVCFTGMTPEETACLTEKMAESGDCLDLSGLPGPSVDKHSTGGVGDKTTLILAPVVAALGGHMVKMSGRGLGHTGGTIDKLEAIPGLRTTLLPEELIRIGRRVGAVIAGQSGDLTPADKRLYALRDGTGTVESIPLIASSIMSKKIAAGCGSILLDVKVGSGAFMKTEDDALELARQMVAIGRSVHRQTMAVLTAMEQPLGRCIGNALEVNEALEILRGEGPDDLNTVILELGTSLAMLALPGRFENREQVEEAVRHVLADGRALAKFYEIAEAQGGDVSGIRRTGSLPLGRVCEPLCAERSGYVTGLNGQMCGFASALLGAGRMKQGDTIDAGAGIRLLAKEGDRVEAGQPIAELYTDRPERMGEAKAHLAAAYQLGGQPGKPRPLLLARVDADGVVHRLAR